MSSDTMKRLKLFAAIAAGVGLVSVMAIVLCCLALTDIGQGGENLYAEWITLRLGFGIIAVFHVTAFVVLFKLFVVAKTET